MANKVLIRPIIEKLVYSSSFTLYRFYFLHVCDYNMAGFSYVSNWVIAVKRYS